MDLVLRSLRCRVTRWHRLRCRRWCSGPFALSRTSGTCRSRRPVRRSRRRRRPLLLPPSRLRQRAGLCSVAPVWGSRCRRYRRRPARRVRVRVRSSSAGPAPAQAPASVSGNPFSGVRSRRPSRWCRWSALTARLRAWVWVRLRRVGRQQRSRLCSGVRCRVRCRWSALTARLWAPAPALVLVRRVAYRSRSPLCSEAWNPPRRRWCLPCDAEWTGCRSPYCRRWSPACSGRRCLWWCLR